MKRQTRQRSAKEGRSNPSLRKSRLVRRGNGTCKGTEQISNMKARRSQTARKKRQPKSPRGGKRIVRHRAVIRRMGRAVAPKGKRPSSRRPSRSSKNLRQSKTSPRRLSARREKAKVRGLNAINRLRRGKSKSLSAAARAEGTTVRTIRRQLPAALIQDPSGRIRVKMGDPYGVGVKIVTDEGRVVAYARNSRERELAGRHRADVFRVLEGRAPKSILRQYRGKTVGGCKLISDFDLLSRLAQAGILEQLESLYVSPGVSA
jgi:hypothetical protein